MIIKSVLVTGAAGDIGRGLSKILRDIPFIEKINGMDIVEQFPYGHFYDVFLKAPRVDEEGYINFLKNVVEKYNIELIIPMSENELRFFNTEKINRVNKIPILMPSYNIMDLGFDKLNTAIFLKENGFPYPWTIEAGTGEPLDLPCIIKGRYGSGSKDVHVVTNDNIHYHHNNKEDDRIYQELLLPHDQEYTCGIFRSKKGETKTIIFKRKLNGGRTGYGEIIKNAEIESLLLDISTKIDFYGSINVQLRLTESGPIIFEINPRFSSTLVFRHKLGFKDVEWAILDKFDQLDKLFFDEQRIIGKKIFRSDEEIIY